MRDYAIFAIIFSLALIALRRPVVGVLAYTWISLMNPHRLTFGAAYDFQFAALVAGATLLGILISRHEKKLPITGTLMLLFLFCLWTNITLFFALEPALAWKEWNRVMKTFLVTFVAVYLLNGEKDIKAFAAVVGLSVGFYGIKGGIFTIATAGNSHVLGPEGSYISDNNTVALALVTVTPILWYLRTHAPNKWLVRALTGATFLNVIAIVGTYSRGALLAGGAMLCFLWLKSEKKLRSSMMMLLIVLVVYLIMPEQWFNRMETIEDYKEDASAMGRINAWMFAINLASENFMGGGFLVFTPKIFMIYAPDPLDYHVAHSIYFQVLGEHGVVGLLLYMLLMLAAWRLGSRVIRLCRTNDGPKWASDLAAMLQVSMVGFAVGGAFLSLAYYDLYFDIIALMLLLEKTIIRQSRSTNANANANMVSAAPSATSPESG